MYSLTVKWHTVLAVHKSTAMRFSSGAATMHAVAAQKGGQKHAKRAT